jgi:transmembrane sensor
MQKKDAKELFKKHREGRATEEEKRLIGDWILFGKFKSADLTDEELEMELSLLDKKFLQPKIIKIRTWPRIAVAVSITLILAFGSYYLIKQNYGSQIAENNTTAKLDILPGSNKATLILSNGKKIKLENLNTGIIASEADATIQQNKNSLIYTENANQTGSQQLVYNTIETKKGEQWPSIELPDGTKAFLDAASSITFPVKFIGNERKVTITGQVYFEVVHNSKKPFMVMVKGQTIEDLGTHFNINAYEDELFVETTLIEGSVSIAKKEQKVVLKPGQQAVTENGNNNIKVIEANTSKVTAWRNGLFNFDNMPIELAMRQLARWYNVDVEYPKGVPKIVFSGQMHRNEKASQILDVLSFFKINFRIEEGKTGKKIMVLP